MAAFLTANRWSSGIGTHKTKEGRIICTGIGCLGCFPETNRTEADELGICVEEIPDKGYLRTFLDQDKNITVAMQKNPSPGKIKGRSKRKKKVTGSSLLTKEIDKSNSDGDDVKVEKSSYESSVHDMARSRNFRTTGTQTPEHDNQRMVPHYSELSKEAQKIVSSMLGSREFPEFKEKYSSEQDQLSSELERCKLKKTIGYSMANSVNQHYNLTENNIKNEAVNRKVNKTARILDSLYVVSKKDIAVANDNILPNEDKDLYWNNWDLGENAVCLYFAIEYFRSERILPVFKVLEIVEALSEVVAVKDIKCVQRNNDIWQIVLSRRNDLGRLRKRGLRIRGRVYELVEDIDSYCQTIYGES
ncbi:uncharacterized protein LOC116308970 [Actinia tenebrosa]|uniref:Uncharacterized protein LOC116308970 n=1 Tax=Actinia tenebrosa TaxID=6105 RepID=A0A6P8JGF7_ACTTE|nr:uncharacterized protein LOC116308970 [Actinia tenebrosa]